MPLVKMPEGLYIWKPNLGVVPADAEVLCGICDHSCNADRNYEGYRSWASSVAEGPKTVFDFFVCGQHQQRWHKQAVALLKAAKETPSKHLEKIFLDEVAEIFRTETPTK